MRRRVRITALVLVASAFLAASGSASADERAECQIFEIEASSGEASLDPALKPLAKKLKRPPFSSWNRFELLKRHSHALVKNKSLELKLVPGGSLSLLFRDLARDQGKKPRLRLTFTLDDKGGKRKLDGTINLDSGDYYLIGGDELPGGGTYILAIGCKAR